MSGKHYKKKHSLDSLFLALRQWRLLESDQIYNCIDFCFVKSIDCYGVRGKCSVYVGVKRVPENSELIYTSYNIMLETESLCGEHRDIVNIMLYGIYFQNQTTQIIMIHSYLHP